MVTNTFSSGVNTSFSTELNENFTEAETTASDNYTIMVSAYSPTLPETFGGTGADGAKTVSSSEDIAAGAYNWSSLTINSGQTLGLSSGNYIYAKVTGNVNIIGTIDLSEDGAAGGSAVTDTDGINGTIGSEVSNGTIGAGALGPDGANNAGAGGGGGGSYFSGEDGEESNATAGGHGGYGYPLRRYLGDTLPPNTIILPFYGAGGGSGGSRQDGYSGKGGTGGGCLIIECAGNITVSGTINVSGEDGGDGTLGSPVNVNGGGGGGGSGSIFIYYKGTLSETTPTYNTSGGTGGLKSGTGGDGGDGGDGIAFFQKILAT